MPRVLNKRKDTIPPDAIYVGRPSKWGNPIAIGRETDDRNEAVAFYRSWVKSEIATGKLDITELEGKDLVCWCAPLPCHADILLELANAKLE